MAGIDYLTSYSKGDVSVILKGDINEYELYSDIIREAMEHPVRFAPPIEIKFVTDDTTTVKTNALIAEFLVNDVFWSGEYKPEMVTIFDFKKPNMFHSPQKHTLPHHIPHILLSQNKKLDLECQKHQLYDTEGIEGVISQTTGRQLEYDAKAFWTSDDKVIKKGNGKTITNHANVLQYRTPKLRILAKIAHNNFVTFFGRVTDPPTDEAELSQLEKKFKDLKYLLIKSIFTKDPNGLIKFYDFIKKEF